MFFISNMQYRELACALFELKMPDEKIKHIISTISKDQKYFTLDQNYLLQHYEQLKTKSHDILTLSSECAKRLMDREQTEEERLYKLCFCRKLFVRNIVQRGNQFIILYKHHASVMNQDFEQQYVIFLPFIYEQQLFSISKRLFCIIHEKDIYEFELKQRLVVTYTLSLVTSTIYDEKRQSIVSSQVLKVITYGNNPLIVTSKDIQLYGRHVVALGYSMEDRLQNVIDCVVFNHYIITLINLDFAPLLLISDIEKQFDYQVFNKEHLLLYNGSYRTASITPLFADGMEARLDDSLQFGATCLELCNNTLYVGFQNCSSVLIVQLSQAYIEQRMCEPCSKQTYQTVSCSQFELQLQNVCLPTGLIYSYPDFTAKRIVASEKLVVVDAKVTRNYALYSKNKNQNIVVDKINNVQLELVYIFDAKSRAIQKVYVSQDNQEISSITIVSDFEIWIKTKSYAICYNLFSNTFMKIPSTFLGAMPLCAMNYVNNTLQIFNRTRFFVKLKLSPVEHMILLKNESRTQHQANDESNDDSKRPRQESQDFVIENGKYLDLRKKATSFNQEFEENVSISIVNEKVIITGIPMGVLAFTLIFQHGCELGNAGLAQIFNIDFNQQQFNALFNGQDVYLESGEIIPLKEDECIITMQHRSEAYQNYDSMQLIPQARAIIYDEASVILTTFAYNFVSLNQIIVKNININENDRNYVVTSIRIFKMTRDLRKDLE